MIEQPEIYQIIAQAGEALSRETVEAFENDTFRLIYTIVGTALTGLIGLGTAAIPFLMRRLEVKAEAGREARDRIQLLLQANRESRKALEALIRIKLQDALDTAEDAKAMTSVLGDNPSKQVEISIAAIEKIYGILRQIRMDEIRIREKRHDEGA